MGKHAFVTERPGINGGYPIVRGTRTPVRVIVGLLRKTDGDIERVATLLPHLTREQICGALSYYAAHPERVNEDIALNESAWAELQRSGWPA